MATNARGTTAPYGRALALLASLFFMWGFITVINNTLLPHLRSVFDLNYTQTTLIESVWFIAYGVASGLLYIIASGQGKDVSFAHVIPQIAAPKS